MGNLADQPPAVDDDAQTVRSSERRQDREVNHAASRRRDRAARDAVPAAGPWGRRQDRRDRDDEYGDDDRRDDDRRIVGRAVREDDRAIGRAPRFGGPLSIFPFPNDW
jgi:hypothetical protein